MKPGKKNFFVLSSVAPAAGKRYEVIDEINHIARNN